MRRKILLAMASFAVLLAAFAAYRYTTTLVGRSFGDSRGGDSLGSERVPAGAGEWIEVVRQDADNRLSSIYRFRRVQKQDNESYNLLEPHFILYLRNNQNVIIRADHGNVTGESVAGGVEPHQGRLWGNVQVTIDRNPGPVPPDERPEDLFRIYLEEITFNNRLLTLEAEGRVAVYSREADIYGTGFFMSWNQDPRELRELRIDQGDQMHIYAMRRDIDMLFLPGGQGDSDTTADSAAPSDVSSPGSPAAKPPAPGDRPVDRPARNVLVADLHDSVRVIASDNRSLVGADKLTLLFEWTGSFDQPDSSRPRRQQRSEGVPLPPDDAAEPAADTGKGQAAETSAEPARDLYKIFWSGPLVIRPKDHVENPSSKRYTVFAEGRSMLLSDGNTRAVCRTFTFRNPEKIGEMRNDDGTNVLLTLRDGQTIETPQMLFNMKAREAFFTGAGRMESPAGAGRSFVTRDPALDAAPAAQELPEPVLEKRRDVITWTDRVTARFEEAEVVGPDGRKRKQQILNEAIFEGDVELLAGSGDYLLCDEQLEVYMATGATGKQFPRKVLAGGNVSANWEDSAIEADFVGVTFKELKETGPEGQELYAVRATRLDAMGSVWMAALSEDGDQVIATSETFESDLLQRTADLRGKPATVISGTDRLEGEHIHVTRLEASPERAWHVLNVNGPGKLSFITARGLNGAEFKTPRPIAIRWKGRMEYRGDRSTAQFFEEVLLENASTVSTPDDPQTRESQTIAARQVDVLFTDRPAPEAAGAAPPAQAPPVNEETRSLGLRMDSYSRQTISLITARGDVKAISLQEDSKGRRLQRRYLQGPQVVYDANRLINRVDVIGAGSLLIEDYRPSQIKKARDSRKADGAPKQAGLLPGGMAAPSQTSFAWTKSLTYKPNEREIFAEGDVRMAHVSGNRVVYARQLNAPDWPELDSGRRFDLRNAQTVIAAFSPPDEAPASEGEPFSLGDIETITAKGKVLAEFDQVSVTSQALLYSRPLEMVTFQGSLPGEPAADAMLTRKDPKTNRPAIFRGREILWFLKNDHIQVRGASGGGPR